MKLTWPSIARYLNPYTGGPVPALGGTIREAVPEKGFPRREGSVLLAVSKIHAVRGKTKPGLSQKTLASRPRTIRGRLKSYVIDGRFSRHSIKIVIVFGG